MSTAQHTPGPWEAHADLSVRTSDGRKVARCSATLGKYEFEAPNARLIAAAPELLATLQFLLNDDAVMLGYHKPAIRAAIAKATGSAA